MTKSPKSNGPRARAVHSDPNVGPTPEQEPLPEGVAKTPVESKSPAEWAYQRLIMYIQNFEKQLGDEHEVAIAATDGGALRIEGIGYFDPDIVTFYGTNPTGARMQLVQHVTQLSVALVAIPKQVPEEKPRRIGFKLASELEQD